jgi:hypothetical protein
MVIPVGSFYQQLKVIARRSANDFPTRDVIPVRFVPMTGEVERPALGGPCRPNPLSLRGGPPKAGRRFNLVEPRRRRWAYGKAREPVAPERTRRYVRMRPASATQPNANA